MIHNYYEFKINNFLDNENYLLNEELNIEKLFSDILKIKNKKIMVNKFIKLFNDTSNFFIKKIVFKLLLMVLLTSYSNDNIKVDEFLNNIPINNYITKISNTKIDINLVEKILINEILPFYDLENDKIKIFPNADSNIKFMLHGLFQKPSEMSISKEGIDFIKHHEKLRLEVYKLGDGCITVGYGHSEPLDTTHYKVGQKISLYKANKLFYRDLNIIEQSVQRLFNRLEKEGIIVKLTQSMYDSFISVAYNTGIGGILYDNMKTKEFSDLYLNIRKGDYIAISDNIKNLKLSAKNRKYFPGLIDRRQNEYDLFMKDILTANAISI
jgi:GH24 family phage-related lysozyme (muramidase)